VDAAAKEFAGEVKIAKLNVDQHKKTASKYGVRGIPAFIIFKDGKRVGTQVGFGGKQHLFTFIRTHTSET
jgi:thioredoxin 1